MKSTEEYFKSFYLEIENMLMEYTFLKKQYLRKK